MGLLQGGGLLFLGDDFQFSLGPGTRNVYISPDFTTLCDTFDDDATTTKQLNNLKTK
jgi:hypothetical protein